MAVTILEALTNAEQNLKTYQRSGFGMSLTLAANQLHNAVTLLEKGYPVYDEVEPLLEKYGSAEEAPDKED